MADGHWSKATPVDYVRGTVTHSKSILGGSVVLGAAGLTADLDHGLTVPPWVFWLLAVAGLCLAQYRAYRDIKVKHDATEEAGALAAERIRHFRQDPHITGETFTVHDLLTPGNRTLVEHRTFTDCTINGPALICFASNTGPEHCTWTPPSDQWLYLLETSGPKAGLVGFVSCSLTRCTFNDVGVLAGPDPELLAMIGRMPVV
jgi:hypothetical protein